MATRTQVRESVIGLLYAVDLGNEGIIKFIDEILEHKKIRNKQKTFALSLFNGVTSNLNDIDTKIKKHLNQGNINSLGSVEKAVLRLAVYELLFENIDKPIIINEAIELSKKLGSENAPRFVNGVLDKISK